MLALHPVWRLTALLLVGLAPPSRADVGTTLAQAGELVARGQPATAVAALEQALADAPEERLGELLESLRAAYEAAIRQAEAEGRPRDAALLRDNLAIIGNAPIESGPAVARPPSPPRMTPAPARLEPDPEAAAPPELDEPPGAMSVAPAPPARDLAAADGAFRGRDYALAGSIYAELADEGQLPEVRRDPWAYCRMVAVVSRINAGARSPAEWTTLRSEIEAIRKLSPKNWYGEYLRNLAAELTSQGTRKPSTRPVLRGASPEEPPGSRPTTTRTHRFVSPETPHVPDAAPVREAAAAVGRPGSPVGSWKVWDTENFRILHDDEALARQVALAAETIRRDQTGRWVGSQGVAAWAPRCDIYLYPTATQFSQMTGQPQDSPGFSTMGLGGGQVVARRVNLRADHPNLLTAVLPHEVTHVVLADVFREIQVPRWADEGMAVLSEPASEQELRAGDLSGPLADNRLFRVADLMSMDYPDGRFWSLYYAQSVSLTRYLVEQGSPEKFIEFVRGSQRAGVDAELKRVYGITSVADLQTRWLAHVRAREKRLAVAETAAGAVPPRR